ncbi:hypothetical protein AgCh_027556 [Apium graveolens]
MKKDSAKLEVILKEKCMCYNGDSSHPRVIRLGDDLERNHISALRTAIYQIGSQGGELKQVKATLAQVLRNAEEKLISNFVKNHFGFRLTQNKHIMIDLGTGNNNKINWAMEDKQEFIDIVEIVYHGARKGHGLVVVSRNYSTRYRY